MTTADSLGIDIEAYYSRYGPMVLRRCRRMLRDEQSAYDAMQEVFLRMLRYQNRLTGAHPSSLLFRMATNICLNRIRDDRKHRLSEYINLLHNISFFSKQDEEASARGLMEYIIRKEKESTRKIAVMYFLDGMTIKEIAADTKLSLSGVHKRLEKLRKKIKEHGEIS